MAVCAAVRLVFYQYRNLYVVDGRHRRCASRCISPRLCHSVAAICSPAHGVGASRRHDAPPTGAAGVFSDELRLSNTVYDAARSGGLWRRPGRLRAASPCHVQLTHRTDLLNYFATPITGRPERWMTDA